MSRIDLTPLANQYILDFAGAKVRVPYWVNSQQLMAAVVEKWIIGPYKGKGTPAQIKRVVEQRLRTRPKSLQTETAYREYMRSIGLGADCSAFVYHVLDGFLRRHYHQRLMNLLVIDKADVLQVYDAKDSWQKKANRSQIERQPDVISLAWLHQNIGKNPRMITNVARLVDPHVVQQISTAGEIQAGDLIKMTSQQFGDHIAVVVRVEDQRIVAAEMIEPENDLGGLVYNTITITDPQQGLEVQKWQHRRSFHPGQGNDGVYRLQYAIKAE